mmetsp:Transcript_32255/g.48659  ORF Transcript_32255/g.48659 Transcript_32255/m.48659 type:complete len:126 (+) Transcript_32255:527-904(+)
MREYLHKGDEVDTLQALWQHCVAHPHEIVSYFHDKGSFHNTSENVKARRLGTKSTFHFHADSILRNNLHECNVCTARFSTQPQYASAANMWTAHCDYVRKLLPPKTYSAAMQTMLDDTLWNFERH